MGSQATKVSFFSFGITGSLRHHHPESVLSTKLNHVLITGIVIHFQGLAKDAADNTGRLRILNATNGSHNCHMQLGSRIDILCHCGYALTAVNAVKELAISLDHAAHGSIVRKTHFVHPNRVKVCSEFFAIKLDINEPIVLRLLIAQRAVHKIVGSGVIRCQQFLGCKGIGTGQNQNTGIIQHQFLNLVLKFPVLVVPEDDTPLIELGQRRSKAPVQVLCYFL